MYTAWSIIICRERSKFTGLFVPNTRRLGGQTNCSKVNCQNSPASFPEIFYFNYIKLFSILKLSFKSSNAYDNDVYRGVGLWLNKCILYRPIYVRCVGTCISVYRPIVLNTR